MNDIDGFVPPNILDIKPIIIQSRKGRESKR